MTVIDPGHEYLLDSLDGEQENHLIFVKREGIKYPGNVGHHPGTTIQEVLRALVHRLNYVYRQQPCRETAAAKNKVEEAIVLLEDRAARIHGRLPTEDVREIIGGWDKCTHCGHVRCQGQCHFS